MRTTWTWSILLISILFGCALLPVRAQQPRPNVVIVMTDDQGVGDFGFMGNPIIRTPQLDRMASQSVHMTNFWVSPVCAPTRASLMTGRYNYRTRCIDTYIGRAMMDTAEVTLAEHFSAGGYATGIFGKWHLGDNAPLRPQDQGFDEVLVHRGGGIGQPSDVIGAEGKYTDPTLIHNGKEKAFGGYCTDIYFKHAMQFMTQQRAKHKPFLSVITTNAPHGPFHDVPEALYQTYKGVDFAPYSVQPLGDKLHDNLRRIAAMITNIDDNMGLLFDFLKDQEMYDNTIVLFLTDNGPNSLRYVGPFRGMKSHVHTGGIRTPLLFHWPRKIKTGVKRAQLAAHYDIAPTLLAACGIDKQGDLPFDGVNVLPAILDDQQVAPERNLYIQTHRGDQPESGHHFAMIGPQYKLLRPSGFGRETNPGNVPLELYDHRADPGERQNLAESRPALLQSMLADYRRWFSDVSTTRADNYAPPRIELGHPDENPLVLTRQDWRHFQGRPWAGGSNGKWLITLKKPLTVSIQFHLAKNESRPRVIRIMNGEALIRTANVQGDDLRVEDVALPQGDVDLWFALIEEDTTLGPYQVHLYF
ncbi:MAG: arylsulfatase [Planctomycetes bacterium]|nr:arylsulfatase [Planctomycetota bacterium]